MDAIDPRVAALAALFHQNPAAGAETAPAAEQQVVVTNLRLTAEAGDPASARITGFVPEMNADCLLAGNGEEAEQFLAVAKPGEVNRRPVSFVNAKGEKVELEFLERDLLGIRVTATAVGGVRESKTANGKVRRTMSVRDAVVMKIGFKPTGKWALG